MGVRSWLAGRAVRATRVLVVEGGGGFVARVAVERSVARRGWRLAESPATADGLVVAGPATGELAQVVERLWDAMPGPRARVAVATVDDVPAALDRLTEHLLDGALQEQDAAARTAPDLGNGHDGMDHAETAHEETAHAGKDHAAMDHGPMDHAGMDHGAMDHGAMDHEGTAHGGMDHGPMDHEGTAHGGMDHGGMDHGDMEMAPDGLSLAEGAEDDRDGLEMDALPVRLGPVLPHWPAGLVVDVTLHGDLVTEPRARLLDDGAEHGRGDPSPATEAARRCDEVAAVLGLAGWDEGASLARAARDDLLDHGGGDARALLVELRHRVERSRLLRWSLGGVGVVTTDDAHRLGLPDEVVGDCRDRLLHLVDRAARAAQAYAGTTGAGAPTAEAPEPAVSVTAVGPLLGGHDLAVVRLVLATLGPPVRSPEGVRHG